MRPTLKRPPARRLTLAVCGVSLALALSACENVRSQLGLGKSSPDEFSVLTRAPLSLPPDYKLRPPDPGAERPQEVSVQEQVKAALYDTTAAAPGAAPTATAGESALLSLAGTDGKQSNIRSVINRDNAIFAEEDGSFVDSIIFWREPQSSDSVVDPSKEDQRLQEAEAAGDAPNSGETAVIERRNEGILEGLF